MKTKKKDGIYDYGNGHQCGHVDELGNPSCNNQGRFALVVDGLLIKYRCQGHINDLKED